MIERANNDGQNNFSPLGSVAGNVDAYTDTLASEGVSYLYQVATVGSHGQGSPSAALTVYVNPAAPTGLTALAIDK